MVCMHRQSEFTQSNSCRPPHENAVNACTCAYGMHKTAIEVDAHCELIGILNIQSINTSAYAVAGATSAISIKLAVSNAHQSGTKNHGHQLKPFCDCRSRLADLAAKGVANCGSRLADLHQLAMAKGAWLAAISLVGRPRPHASTTSHTHNSRNVELVVWAQDRDVAESGPNSLKPLNLPACPTY